MMTLSFGSESAAIFSPSIVFHGANLDQGVVVVQIFASGPSEITIISL